RGPQRGRQTVLLQDARPRRFKLVDLPKRARRDLPLIVQATGFDYESRIRQVSFFVGKPVDGKVPPTAIPVRAEPDDSRTSWSARVPMPPTAKGPTDLTVQFVNGVGQSTFETATIDVSETGVDAS